MRKVVITALFVLLTATLNAQSGMTSQFLDLSPFSFRFNPAYATPDLTVGVLLSDVSASATTTHGVLDFFQEQDGSLVSFLDKRVNTQEVMSRFKEDIAVSTMATVNLLTVGWTKKKHHPLICIDITADVAALVPSDILGYLKEDANEPLDISGTEADVSSWLSIRGGDRIDLSDKLSVGWGVKLLASPVKANLDVKSGLLTSREGVIESRINADLVSAGYLLLSNEDGLDCNPGGPYIGGIGAGVDLGVQWRPTKGLDLSLALLNFGFTKWEYDYNGHISGGSLDLGELDDIDPNTLLTIIDGRPSKGSSPLPWSVNARIRYAMPFWRALKIGASYNRTRSGTIKDEQDIQGAVILSPWKRLSIAAGVGTGTYGFNCGGAITATIWKFNIHASLDSYMTDYVNVFVTKKDAPEQKSAPLPAGSGRVAANIGLALAF